MFVGGKFLLFKYALQLLNPGFFLISLHKNQCKFSEKIKTF